MAWIGRLAIQAALLAAFLPCSAEPLAPAYGRAFDELAGYCMGNVCLGMSIPEVRKLGPLTFGKWTPPNDPQPVCSFLAAGRGGLLQSRDGERVQLGFELVGSTGTPESRYRVMAMTRTFPGLDAADIDRMRLTLTKRYGGMQRDTSPSFPSGAGRWTKTAGDFTLVVSNGLYVQGGLLGQFGEPGRYVSVMASLSPDWFNEQSACDHPPSQTLPKL